MTDNNNCPDHTSHSENAHDRWVETNHRVPTLPEDFEQIDFMAEAEYQACEGH